MADGPGITGTQIAAWIARAHEHTMAFRSELNALDAHAGDGDIGDNAVRGFAAATTVDADRTAQQAVRELGRAFLSGMGGSSGTLLGMGTLAAAATMSHGEPVDPPALVAAARAALESVKQRGKAQPGDRTMVDAWEAALSRVEAVDDERVSLPKRALAGALDGLRATSDMAPRRGRAVYLGERARAMPDAGALLITLAAAALDPAATPERTREELAAASVPGL